MFVLAIALSLLSGVALQSFETGIRNSLGQDAKTLAGGDIIVTARKPFSENLSAELQKITADQAGVVSESLSFPTVVAAPSQDASLLVNIRVVADTYPLYGTVQLAQNKNLSEILRPGSIVAEKDVFARLGVQVGDTLKIGAAEFLLAGEVTKTPDEAGDIFTSGQTIFLRAEDAAKTELIGTKSRISYTAYIRLNDAAALEKTVAGLKAVSGERERVNSFLNTRSSTQRFIENFLFFVNFISIFTLVLSGIAMGASIAAYFRRRRNTIAIFKTLGMKNAEILRLFLGFIFLLSIVGSVIGLLGSTAVLHFLPQLFRDLLPEGFAVHLELKSIVEGLLIGIFVSGIFTALPLLKLKDIKPLQVLQKNPPEQKKWRLSEYLLIALLGGLFSAFILLRVSELRLGIYFILGSIGFLSAIFLCCSVLFALLKNILDRGKNLYLKLAGKGLLRPGNSSRMIITALASAFTVILSISLLEKNITAQFVGAYPESYPNVFFLDIQKDQRQDFMKYLPENSNFYPVIRGNLIEHNGEKITDESQGALGERGDDVTRSFNLTYGVSLSTNETLLAAREPGKMLLENYARPGFVQVSVLKEFAELLGIQVGDTVKFSIQGVELAAEVVSMRERKEERVEPFFYFIFDPEALASFPQTLFTTAKVDPEKIAALQNTVTKNFPNITTIDLTVIIKKATDVLAELTSIIRFFSFFSLSAGLLLLISSLLATASDRIRETVYYKLLGVRRSGLLRIAFYELLFLGIFAALLGSICAEIGVGLLTKKILDIEFFLFGNTVGGFSLILFALIFVLAGVIILPLLKTRPIEYLRENSSEEF